MHINYKIWIISYDSYDYADCWNLTYSSYHMDQSFLKRELKYNHNIKKPASKSVNLELQTLPVIFISWMKCFQYILFIKLKIFWLRFSSRWLQNGFGLIGHFWRIKLFWAKLSHYSRTTSSVLKYYCVGGPMTSFSNIWCFILGVIVQKK